MLIKTACKLFRTVIMKTNELVNKLKESAQDYEFYPTTDEMIAIIKTYIKNGESVLDIGAGDGRVLAALTDGDRYSIEKSEILRTQQDPDIVTLGTDFHEQTLIDKSVSVVFCNPPYSEYAAWAERIIREARAKRIYLIIPRRWKENKAIKAAIEAREATARIVWSGDFLEADRAARAIVDIVEIKLSLQWNDRFEVDPFDLWFDEFYPEFDKAAEVPDNTEAQKERMNNIVMGRSRVEHLCQCYREDMNKLCENYRAVGSLDHEILKEIGVDKKGLKIALKEKIRRCKSLYWHELINRLDAVTDRLTKKTREELLQKIDKNLSVDFTEENAFAVVLWFIKNANKYMNKQIVDLFKEMSRPDNVRAYKSNQKTWKFDNWRYTENTHYKLDYRIILSQGTAIKVEQYSSYNYHRNLSKRCHDLLNDIITIAKTLGWSIDDNSYNHYEWESNKSQEFYTTSDEVFMEVKAFKNGNLHIKLDTKFIKTLNVEAARLLGWIKTAQEATDEMEISLDETQKMFTSVYQYGNNVKLLCS